MALKDYKISEFENPVEKLEDNPSQVPRTAEEIKKWFDSNSDELREKVEYDD